MWKMAPPLHWLALPAKVQSSITSDERRPYIQVWIAPPRFVARFRATRSDGWSARRCWCRRRRSPRRGPRTPGERVSDHRQGGVALERRSSIVIRAAIEPRAPPLPPGCPRRSSAGW